MKKHTTTTAVAAAIVTALAGGVTSCSGTTSTHNTASSTPPSPTTDPSQHVMRLLEGPGGKHNHDDHYLGENQLRSPGTHQILGYDNYTGYSTNQGRLIFWETFALHGGLIDTYFNVQNPTHSLTGQITHGSGTYRGITGTIHATGSNHKGPTVYTLRYQLR